MTRDEHMELQECRALVVIHQMEIEAVLRPENLTHIVARIRREARAEGAAEALEELRGVMTFPPNGLGKEPNFRAGSREGWAWCMGVIDNLAKKQRDDKS